MIKPTHREFYKNVPRQTNGFNVTVIYYKKIKIKLWSPAHWLKSYVTLTFWLVAKSSTYFSNY